MQNFNQFKELLSTPKKCIIVTHTKPDADALGSSLGLGGYLQKKGHDVTVISPTDYPDFLKWMKGNDDVIVYNNGNEDKSGSKINDADILFCLDFSSLDRINELGEKIAASTSVKVLIDHHLDPDDFADFTLWSTEAAATAELIFDLIVDLGDEDLIDQPIAENLYAGIMTDTGSFRHSCTSAKVFEVASRLVTKGANVNAVSRYIYDANSLNRLRLMGYALAEKLKVLPAYRTAYIALSADDLKKYHYSTGDSEGLVNYGLSIDGVIMAATIIEREDGIKMSFRSVGDFSVNQFAREHFDGGGHKNAAGGKSSDSLEEVVQQFESLLTKYEAQLSV